MPSPHERIRVLIADDDKQTARRLSDYLTERGFVTQCTESVAEAKAIIPMWKPRFVIADLLIPEGSALALIDYTKSLRHQFIHVIVMSAHNLEVNVRQCIERGAKDYIVKPFRNEDLLKRLVFHSRAYRPLRDLPAHEKVDEASMMLHLTDLVMKQALGHSPLDEILFNLTRMVTLKVDGVRCSVVHCVDAFRGVVVTSNDDRKASGIQLDLNKYPEIVHVMNTKTLVAIENLDDNPELRGIRDMVKEISFNSLIVCPITRHGQPFGVLSLRMPPERKTVSDNEIRFVEIVAHVISLVLGNEMHKETGDFWRQGKDNAPLPFPSRQVKNS